MLIALCGGCLGALLATTGVRALASLIPVQIPRARAAHMEAAVLLYSFAATIASGLLFGLAPAWQGARIGLIRAIQSGASGRLRNAIAVVEIGLHSY